MSRAASSPVKPGTPRSPEAAERLARFERRTEIPLVLAAVAPILLSAGHHRGAFAAVTYVVTWLVFVVDFAVHQRLTARYLHGAWGRFDLAVVILTAPWMLIPGYASSRFLVVIRLARLARMLMATRAARNLIARLGRAAIIGTGLVFVCSYIAYHAERATNPGFDSYTDALWWGVVTVTTVGYGDIVPKTGTGRWAGAILMVTGIGIIGALAGSLASFLRLGSAPPLDAKATRPDDHSSSTLHEQMTALRGQLSSLEARLAEMGGDPARSEARGGDDPAGEGYSARK